MRQSTPTPRHREPSELAVTYSLFIGLISLIGLVVMLGYYLLPLPAPVRQVLFIADAAICILLLFDFLIRLWTAPHKKAYLIRSGWLDLLGSLPGLPALRLFRIGSIIRTTRRLLGTTPHELRLVARRRLAESTLLVTTLAVYVVLIVGSSAVVLVESQAPNGNIRTGSEAVWWAIVTIATVGFGDYYPVTNAGRLFAVAIMISGIGLLGVITSYLASSFIARPGADRDNDIRAVRQELAEIRALLREREQAVPARGESGPEHREPPA